MRTQITFTFATTLLVGLIAVAMASSAAASGVVAGSGGGGGGGGGGSHGGGGGGVGGGGASGGGGFGGRGGYAAGGPGAGGGYGGARSASYAVHGSRGSYGVVGYESAGFAAARGERGAGNALTLGPRLGSAATAKRMTDHSFPRPLEQRAPRPGRPPRPGTARITPVVNLQENCSGGSCEHYGPNESAYCNPWIYQISEHFQSLGCLFAIKGSLQVKPAR